MDRVTYTRLNQPYFVLPSLSSNEILSENFLTKERQKKSCLVKYQQRSFPNLRPPGGFSWKSQKFSAVFGDL